MAIELRMPALSPTMEKGTLAKWLVGVGDLIRPGDLVAEIETDKATMEFEAADEGRLAAILVPEGSDDVPVGTVIATLVDADAEVAPAAAAAEAEPRRLVASEAAAATVAGPEPAAAPDPAPVPPAAPQARLADKVKASPLAARIAAARGIDLATLTGSGPNGRIIKADLGGARATGKPAAAPATAPAAASIAEQPRPAPASAPAPAGVPHEVAKLSNMRRTIARRLTESKQTVPHIYLTVDVRLDALLKLRAELNHAMAARGIKLSVNDMLVKAQAIALIEVPAVNVQFTGDSLLQFNRADIAVAVSIPGGLITPVVTAADAKALSAIATEIKDLAVRARDGKLKPEEYAGGTASLSNMGMYGIRQFDAIINPPQAMILAIGAGEQRPYVVDGQLAVATVMCATGSFDHRAIDGADGAAFMAAFKRLVENPTGIIA